MYVITLNYILTIHYNDINETYKHLTPWTSVDLSIEFIFLEILVH